MRSTNFNRTVETARLVVSGLFGTKGMGLQVATIPVEKEFLSPNTRICPRLRQLFLEARKLRSENRSDAAKTLIAKLATSLQAKPKEIHSVGLHDVIVSRRAHSKVALLSCQALPPPPPLVHFHDW